MVHVNIDDVVEGQSLVSFTESPGRPRHRARSCGLPPRMHHGYVQRHGLPDARAVIRESTATASGIAECGAVEPTQNAKRREREMQRMERANK